MVRANANGSIIRLRDVARVSLEASSYMIYKNSPRSYKDLPLRIAEFGTVCRYEQSGELHGLTRVRSFTQDDAHLFCHLTPKVWQSFGKSGICRIRSR